MDVDIVIFRRRVVIGELTSVLAAAMATESTDLRASLPGERDIDLPPWVQLPNVLYATSNEAATLIEITIEDNGITFLMRPDWGMNHVQFLQQVALATNRRMGSNNFGGGGQPTMDIPSISTDGAYDNTEDDP